MGSAGSARCAYESLESVGNFLLSDKSWRAARVKVASDHVGGSSGSPTSLIASPGCVWAHFWSRLSVKMTEPALCAVAAPISMVWEDLQDVGDDPNAPHVRL